MSRKPTQKQMNAQAVNKAQRAYQQKISDYEERVARLSAELSAERERRRAAEERYRRLSDENGALSEKVAQYDEWLERMQDFCNLPEGERGSAFETYVESVRAKKAADESVARIMEFGTRVAGMFIR